MIKQFRKYGVIPVVVIENVEDAIPVESMRRT